MSAITSIQTGQSLPTYSPGINPDDDKIVTVWSTPQRAIEMGDPEDLKRMNISKSDLESCRRLVSSRISKFETMEEIIEDGESYVGYEGPNWMQLPEIKALSDLHSTARVLAQKFKTEENTRRCYSKFIGQSMYKFQPSMEKMLIKHGWKNWAVVQLRGAHYRNNFLGELACLAIEQADPLMLEVLPSGIVSRMSDLVAEKKKIYEEMASIISKKAT